ncbi:hypothetical protein K2173_021063 [Erythroxylum novogranatense]|uniref:Ubiquitin-like domain-containing protein n=1 Tax=Erythroxylum novogranatense TaxID=1862640 RepID=A0AAV8TQK3_9ROSI|nr:hypothetical protein K2173_021063 [Erythroxylum novogranatense]
MDSNVSDNILRGNGPEGSEAMIEIKIKTLDSQTYTLRVDKQMPVPALKEQIASVTGVLSEQQRLICRGKVLKDDQLLSAYHVEDGHTLHLVVRQPVSPSHEGLPNHPGASPGHSGQVGSNVVIETFSVPDQGEGVPPEISRIVSAVLGSFGLSNIASGSEVFEVGRERSQQRTSTASVPLDATQLQSDQASNGPQSTQSQSAFGLPSAVSLGLLHPPVLPDSLTTLSQNLANLRREFNSIVTARGGENNVQADIMHANDQRDSSSISQAVPTQERLPSPAFLAEVMLSSRRLLIEQVAECLHQLTVHLENQESLTDTARLSTQSNAWRAGLQLHNLGAFLLELGRTTMTLRLGQAPSEGLVNAGPAVFINPSGPNPLMVQPLPFQPGSTSGAIPVGSVQPGSGVFNAIGTGFLPRRIDIQIRRGSPTAAANVNREERPDVQQAPGQENQVTDSAGEGLGNQTVSRVTEGSSLAGDSGVRVVPIRTVVAAVPGSFSRRPSDSSGSSVGLYYPLLGRFQHVASGWGSHAASENDPAVIQNTHNSTLESAVLEQNLETREGSTPTRNARQQEPSSSHNIDIDVLSTTRAQNNHVPERQIPHNVMQLLRNLFSGGDIQVQDGSLPGIATGSIPETAGVSNLPVESEARATDEGIYLSRLLREIIPFVSQHQGPESSGASSAEGQTSRHQSTGDSSTQAENSDVGTSHRRSNSEPNPPSSKRQKTE